MPVALPLAGVLVALVIILILVAAWVFAELLARVLGGVPFIGGWIAANVRAAVSIAANAVGSAWDWVMADLGWLFAAVAVWGWEWLYANSRSIGHAVNMGAKAEADAQAAIATIGPAVSAGVSVAEGVAQGMAAHVYNALADWIAAEANQTYSLVATAEADARAGVARAVSDLSAWITAEANQTYALVGGLGVRIDELASVLSGDVSGLVDQIKADLGVAIATAEQAAAAAEAKAVSVAATLAQEAAGGAIGALDQAAHDLVLGPWAALLPAIEPIAGALDPAVAGALGLPGILGESLPMSVPAILSAVIPTVAAVATEVDQCLVPNCSAVKNMGGLFNGLAELGLAATLMALVGEAVADPQAAAGELVAAGNWVGGMAAELVAEVAG